MTQEQEHTNTNPDNQLNMESYLTYGLVARLPLYAINEIKQVLEKHGESMRFKYEKISGGKLRIEDVSEFEDERLQREWRENE